MRATHLARVPHTAPSAHRSVEYIHPRPLLAVCSPPDVSLSTPILVKPIGPPPPESPL